MRLLDENARKEFEENGYILLKGFYQSTDLFDRLKKEIKLLGSLLKNEGGQPDSLEEFDTFYRELLVNDRKKAAQFYDAVKLLPCFNRWSHDAQHYKLAACLMDTELVGFCRFGNGIRLDAPDNDFALVPHQEFPYQGRSTKGLVFWTPLIDMSEELGPVQIWEGSHRFGPLPMNVPEDFTTVTSLNISIRGVGQILEKGPMVSPILEVGDLLVMDFLTIHASGCNRSSRVRWSMQTRFFGFDSQDGIDSVWERAQINSPLFWRSYEALVGGSTK